MGFFEEAGRRVEEFKQRAAETAAENARYRCRECDERFHVDHDYCPECGSEAVASTDSPE